MRGEAISSRPNTTSGQVDRTALRVNHRDMLRPAGLLRPDVHAEDPAPHRFAQGLGAAVLLAASLALFFGAAAAGWGLAFVVIALAAAR